MKIYKYEIRTVDRQFIKMPKGAKPLCVQMQKGTPCIWSLVDTKENEVDRTILIYGTGSDVKHGDEFFDYLGTYQEMGGALVWHVFVSKS